MAPKKVLQDWFAFPLYMTSAVWLVMTNEHESQLTKLTTLLQHLTSLGLTHASEPTQALIAAFLSAFDPNGAYVRANANMGLALLGTVKNKLKTFAERALRAGQLPPHLPVLPADVNQLPAAHAKFFSAGFVAVPEQVPLSDIVAWARVWPMRKTNSLVQPAKQTGSSAQSTDALAVLQQAAQLMLVLQGGGNNRSQAPQELQVQYLDRGHASGSARSSSQLALEDTQDPQQQGPQQPLPQTVPPDVALPAAPAMALALPASSAMLWGAGTTRLKLGLLLPCCLRAQAISSTSSSSSSSRRATQRLLLRQP